MEVSSEPADGSHSSAASAVEGSVASAAAAAAAAASAMTPKMVQSVEYLKLEHQFIRVPFEHLKKAIRANHRCAEKEVSAVLSGVADAAELSNEILSKDDAVTRLTSLVSRLQGLKRKLEEGSKAENLQAQRCRTRLDHLEVAEPDNQSDWYDTRLKRILVDYMLRMSYYDSASRLAQLGNIQSKFEFQLRLQEFIELVRADSDLQAVHYAQRYLAPWGATYMKELQHVFAAVAFKGNTACENYKSNMVSPCSAHQLQLAFISQQQALLMAAASSAGTSASGPHPRNVALPSQMWPNLSYQVPGMTPMAVQNTTGNFSQMGSIRPARSYGSYGPYAASSTSYPMGTVNGAPTQSRPLSVTASLLLPPPLRVGQEAISISHL